MYPNESKSVSEPDIHPPKSGSVAKHFLTNFGTDHFPYFPTELLKTGVVGKLFMATKPTSSTYQ